MQVPDFMTDNLSALGVEWIPTRARRGSDRSPLPPQIKRIML